MKHYLREEDGVYWEDYRGVLPESFARSDEIGFNTQRTEGTKSYAATQNSSVCKGERSLNSRTAPDDLKPDATKRVRVKRSKKQLSGPTAPLLGGTRLSVGYHAYANEVSLPLPLVSVSLYIHTQSLTSYQDRA